MCERYQGVEMCRRQARFAHDTITAIALVGRGIKWVRSEDQ